MSKGHEYRPEIDGLRAVAVIPVVLFHADVPGFDGGFIGVDVFFVISGYLITKLLYADLTEQNFTFIGFYERRARRLLPALFSVLVLTSILAWMWLMPSQLVDFGQSLFAVSVFSSNVLFWSESGYFSASAEEKPLLHTWSLGVEEQFYLLFPLILLGLYRFCRGGIAGSILCLAGASFILSILISDHYPSANFYLLFSRAWELLLGSFVALHLDALRSSQSAGVRKPILDIMPLISVFILITFIFFWAGESYAGPYDLLLPVIATAALIALVRPDTVIYKIFSTRLLVFLGLISYSLYLWHQPLLAYTRILSSGELSLEMAWIAILISFLMAIFSWKYIERPFRNRYLFSNKFIYLLSSCSLFIFAMIGLSFHLNNGFPQRVNIEGSTAERIAGAAIFREWDFSGYPTPKSVTRVNGVDTAGAGSHYILVGDSHALQYWYGMADYALKSQSGERPLMVSLNPASFPPALDELNILENTKYVVFSYFWSLKFGYETVNNDIRCCGDGPGGTIGRPIDVLTQEERLQLLADFGDLFARLLDENITPVVILDNPFGEELNAKSLLSISRSSGLTVSLNDKYSLSVARDVLEDRRSQSVHLLQSLPMRDQLIFLDPYEALCHDEFCDVINGSENFVYKDYDHLAHSVAVEFVPYIFGNINEKETTF